LDVACGAGRNAILLAQRGLHVIGLDISPVAIALAQEASTACGVHLDLAIADALAVAWPPARYDIILNFYFLERRLIPWLRQSLRPGGLLFFQTFLLPSNPQELERAGLIPDHFLRPHELLGWFTEETEEVIVHRQEVGRHRGQPWPTEGVIIRRR
jgi:SAM-dependent methyltransferase